MKLTFTNIIHNIHKMASSKKYIRAGRISMHKNDLQKDVKKQIATD